MGDCTTAIQKIIFDISDDQITRVKIEITFSGDCPHVLKRVYEKSFPARMTMADILKTEVPHYLLWG